MNEQTQNVGNCYQKNRSGNKGARETKESNLSLLAYIKKRYHKKVFINSETLTIVKGEIPKWTDLFINI